nr:hypothetical protein [uncultured Campylobacter sp.]
MAALGSVKFELINLASGSGLNLFVKFELYFIGASLRNCALYGANSNLTAQS